MEADRKRKTKSWEGNKKGRRCSPLQRNPSMIVGTSVQFSWNKEIIIRNLLCSTDNGGLGIKYVSGDCSRRMQKMKAAKSCYTSNPARPYEYISNHIISLLRLPFILRKFQTNTIHTVPLIRRRRVSLSLKHMAQMSPTVRAHDLSPSHAQRLVLVSGNRSGDGIEISRPAASRGKFVSGFVEWSPTARTFVDPG